MNAMIPIHGTAVACIYMFGFTTGVLVPMRQAFHYIERKRSIETSKIRLFGGTVVIIFTPLMSAFSTDTKALFEAEL